MVEGGRRRVVARLALLAALVLAVGVVFALVEVEVSLRWIGAGGAGSSSVSLGSNNGNTTNTTKSKAGGVLVGRDGGSSDTLSDQVDLEPPDAPWTGRGKRAYAVRQPAETLVSPVYLLPARAYTGLEVRALARILYVLRVCFPACGTYMRPKRRVLFCRRASRGCAAARRSPRPQKQYTLSTLEHKRFHVLFETSPFCRDVLFRSVPFRSFPFPSHRWCFRTSRIPWCWSVPLDCGGPWRR